MTIDIEPEIASPAWYYARMMFSRGRPGQLMLRQGRLTFVTAPKGTATSSWHENDNDPETTLIDVPVDDVDAISYNWLIGGLTVRQGTKRHIVGFTGPPTGGHVKDAMSLVSALTTLGRWRAVLGEGADPS